MTSSSDDNTVPPASVAATIAATQEATPAATPATTPAVATPANMPSLKTLTLAQIAAGLDADAFSVVQLVQAHIDQIARFDGQLHAVLQLNPRALDTARALDAELSAGGGDVFRRRCRRRPLHGVPILVKDNIATSEPALEATAGSLALLGAKPPRENAAVTRLRNAGCVLLGTTNCSEWANFRSQPADSGWSARGGQTFGAYHERQDPSGSSSGSAVAVDMGFCVLAVGTETSGSIISPSALNNIVGLKPTTGLVSRDAVVPISPQQDTLGPMARTVVDAAAMLTIMAGRDEHDAKTAEIPFNTIPNYGEAAATSNTGMRPLRIGIPRDAYKTIRKEIISDFESYVEAPLRNQPGITIVDCSLPGILRFEGLTRDERTNYMAGEFHDALPAYLATLTTNPQNIDSLEALCTFLKTTPGEEYGELEEEVEEAGSDSGSDADAEAEKKEKEKGTNTVAVATDSNETPRRNIARLKQTQRITRDSPEFAAAKANAAYFAGPGGIQGALDGNQGGSDRPHGFNNHEPVDALLVPTGAGSANYFAACEGHPQITIPLGYRNSSGPKPALSRLSDTGRLYIAGPNMPYGVSIIGRKYSEMTLLPLCAAVEALTRTRNTAEERRLKRLRG